MKIVILDAYSLNPGDLDWSPMKALGEVTMYDRTAKEYIVERSREADIVLTNKVPFSQETLAQLPRLKMIGVMATGYNIIDCEAASNQGITVCNIPAYSTASVAQMVMAQLLTITNRIEHYTHQIVDEGSWTKNPDFCYWDTPLVELAGKRMGIYGMGRIGQAVARAAMALGMEVVTCSKKAQSELPEGVVKVDDETFWTTCHIYSLHCPLTPQTQSLINEQSIARMRKGTILLNTSRGPVVDEQAVANALQRGQLGAFAADVLSVEPAKADNPLLKAPNVFLTPHIAWATLEARQRLMAILTDNVRAYLNGHAINKVN